METFEPCKFASATVSPCDSDKVPAGLPLTNFLMRTLKVSPLISSLYVCEPGTWNPPPFAGRGLTFRVWEPSPQVMSARYVALETPGSAKVATAVCGGG